MLSGDTIVDVVDIFDVADIARESFSQFVLFLFAWLLLHNPSLHSCVMLADKRLESITEPDFCTWGHISTA